ncbi:glycosyltransferase [Alicyclobacillus sendaiensis PA2]|uniref:Glycosyltransferase n=2 Tax=Alicyclobacillus sendaiensis TaxID=192387 RepID=A0ABT6Y156_ALISE|nr:glycosyltransferase [Alicyclobacillus sendaiensis]MDI9261085.1 glycosyltransferase [Alicyclobacillus sendaiensis PA2]
MRIEGARRPRVQVQIVTYNSASHIGRCLQSLAKQTAVIDRVLVIDNASTDDTAAIARAANVRVLQMERNVGYAGGHNQGFRMAIEFGMDVVVTLNPDVELDPQYIDAAVETLWEKPNRGAVTGRLIRPNGCIDGVGLGSETFCSNAKDREIAYVKGMHIQWDGISSARFAS